MLVRRNPPTLGPPPFFFFPPSKICGSSIGGSPVWSDAPFLCAALSRLFYIGSYSADLSLLAIYVFYPSLFSSFRPHSARLFHFFPPYCQRARLRTHLLRAGFSHPLFFFLTLFSLLLRPHASVVFGYFKSEDMTDMCLSPGSNSSLNFFFFFPTQKPSHTRPSDHSRCDRNPDPSPRSSKTLRS